MSATPDPAVATIPAPPAWATTTMTTEGGRQFSAGFAEGTRDGDPPFTVEIVQDEYLDGASEPVTIRRAEPRLYICGPDSYSPGQAAELVQIVRGALTALGSAGATASEAE